MTREKAIQELISVIPIGRTQKDRYIETLIEVINKPKPTEQEIFKKFEELGWKFFRSEGFFGEMLTIEKATLEITIYINMKIYEITQRNIRDGLTMKEHQLLTELFKCWGWFEC